MEKVIIKNLDNDKFDFYLLNSKIINIEDADSLIRKLYGDNEIQIIQENGITASNTGFWVIKKSKEGSYIEMINFDDDSQFEFIKK
jgi:hypothetical protein